MINVTSKAIDQGTGVNNERDRLTRLKRIKNTPISATSCGLIISWQLAEQSGVAEREEGWSQQSSPPGCESTLALGRGHIDSRGSRQRKTTH